MRSYYLRLNTGCGALFPSGSLSAVTPAIAISYKVLCAYRLQLVALHGGVPLDCIICAPVIGADTNRAAPCVTRRICSSVSTGKNSSTRSLRLRGIQSALERYNCSSPPLINQKIRLCSNDGLQCCRTVLSLSTSMPVRGPQIPHLQSNQ